MCVLCVLRAACCVMFSLSFSALCVVRVRCALWLACCVLCDACRASCVV